MKDMTLATLIAVFIEMLGVWFWSLVAAIILGGVAIVVIFLRDRRIHAERLVRAEIFGGLSGGIFAIALAQIVTQSRLSDIGGPIDWFLYAMLFGLGAIGGTIFGYVGQSLRPLRS